MVLLEHPDATIIYGSKPGFQSTALKITLLKTKDIPLPSWKSKSKWACPSPRQETVSWKSSVAVSLETISLPKP